MVAAVPNGNPPGPAEQRAADAPPGLQRDVPLPEPDDDGARPMARDERDPLLLRTLAQLLTDPDALKPPEAIVPRFAWRGRTVMISGREKQGGKSTVCTAGAAAVTRGAPFLDGQCVPGRVLWVSADQEAATDIIQRAVRFGAQPEHFHVLWPRTPFADLMAALDGLNPFPALLVLDTLSSFAHTLVDDPFSSAQWPAVLMPLIRIARDMNIAVQIIHHARKAEGGGYRDSSSIGALVDMLLELQPDAGNPAVRKVKALGRWATTDFAVELVGDTYHLLAGDLSLDARVLHYLQQHPKSSLGAVRIAMGGRHEDTDAAIARLLQSDAVADASTSTNRHAYTAVGARSPDAEDTDVPF